MESTGFSVEAALLWLSCFDGSMKKCFNDEEVSDAKERICRWWDDERERTKSSVVSMGPCSTSSLVNACWCIRTVTFPQSSFSLLRRFPVFDVHGWLWMFLEFSCCIGPRQFVYVSSGFKGAPHLVVPFFTPYARAFPHFLYWAWWVRIILPLCTFPGASVDNPLGNLLSQCDFKETIGHWISYY